MAARGAPSFTLRRREVATPTRHSGSGTTSANDIAPVVERITIISYYSFFFCSSLKQSRWALVSGRGLKSWELAGKSPNAWAMSKQTSGHATNVKTTATGRFDLIRFQTVCYQLAYRSLCRGMPHFYLCCAEEMQDRNVWALTPNIKNSRKCRVVSHGLFLAKINK